MIAHTRRKKKVAIVGGGITGLVAGLRLLERGYQVTIFEKNEQVGGLLAGFKINGKDLEKAYHHIFATDTDIIDLIGELGLKGKLKWYPENTAIYFEQKLYPFNGPKDLLTFGAIPLVDRVRTGLVGLWLQKDKAWEKYKNIPAYKWMKKWNGEAAYGVIWEPLLRGKFHHYYKEVSMAWLWARIHTRGNSNGKLGYMDGGFQILIDALVKKIVSLGGVIKTNTFVKDLNKLEEDYDKVLMTGPIKGIDYLGAVEVVFSSSQSLSRHYWHNINDSNSPFLAFIQQTNLVDKNNYGGKHVYYMGTYVPHDHKIFGMTENEIERLFFDYLKKIFPKFDKKLVGETFLFKLANAQHVVTTNYVTPAYETKNPKVFQANFSHIFPEDRGTNFAVREGNKIASILLQP